MARRLGGPDATASPAYRERRPRDNVRIDVVNRTFVVTVPAGQEDSALQRALADPDVQRVSPGGQGPA